MSESFTNQRSRTTYRTTLNRFFFYLNRNSRNVRNITRTDVMDYKAQMISDKKSALTIDNYLASVRQFFRWLSEKDYHANVADGIRSPSKGRKFRKKYLSPDQVKRLLGIIPQDTLIGSRDYAIVSLMVRTGMRCVEVERLDVDDVIKDDDVLAIRVQRKSRVEKEESIGLTEKTIDALNDYLVKRDISNNPPLFVNHAHRCNNQRIKSYNINRIVKKYMSSIGLTGKKYTAHSLRHTVACNALASGQSIYDVKALLGHTSVSTTEIYTSMMDEQKRLINTPGKALDKLY